MDQAFFSAQGALTLRPIVKGQGEITELMHSLDREVLDVKPRTAVDISCCAEVEPMRQTYTAVVKYDGSVWIGWIEEVPGVNCQEATREDLLTSLRVALAEAIEFNRAEARDAAGKDYEELPLAV